jgi:hypothetical protein
MTLTSWMFVAEGFFIGVVGVPLAFGMVPPSVASQKVEAQPGPVVIVASAQESLLRHRHRPQGRALREAKRGQEAYEVRGQRSSHWPTQDQDDRDLEQRLRGKFQLNAFDGNTVFFPNQALSADCATWAVDTAGNFLRYAFGLLGVPATFGA